MASITLPDGRTISFPDGLNANQVHSIVQAAMAAGDSGAPATDPADPNTWPKDAAGQPMNPQAPQPQGMPTGIVPPRTLLAGAVVDPLGGLAQHATGLAEGVGLAPAGSTQAVTQAVQGAEGLVAGKKVEDMTPDEREAMDAMGLVSSLAVPMGGVAKFGEGLFGLGAAATRRLTALEKVGKFTATATKAATTGAAVGAGAGALSYDRDVTKAWEANMGLASGALIGSVMAPVAMLPAALRNRMLKILREPPTPESRALLDKIRSSDLWKSAEKRLSLGQWTGDVRVEQQEARTRGRIASNLENRQADLAESRVKQIVAGAQQTPLSTIASDLTDSLKAARVSRQQARSTAFGNAIDEAERLAAADPVNVQGVGVPNLTRTLLDLHDTDPGAWQMLYDSAPSKYRNAVREALTNIAQNGGRMGLADLMKVHQTLNVLRSGLGKASTLTGTAASANRMARELQSALQADMDHMESVMGKARELKDKMALHGRPIPPDVAAAGEGYSAAWQTFKDARAEYTASMRKERQLNATVLEKTFKVSPSNPGEAFQRMMDAPVAEQVRMRNLMDPGAVQDLKRWALQDALDNAVKQATEGNKAPLDPAALIKRLTNGRDVRGQALWTQQEIKDIEAGVSYLRMIQSKSTLKDPGVEPQRVLMAMVSWSKAFVAGNAYRLLVNPNMERMFFTAKGREVLRTLATAPKGTAKYVAATGWLAEHVAQSMNDKGDNYGDGSAAEDPESP